MNYEIRYVRGHVEVYDQSKRDILRVLLTGEAGEGGRQASPKKMRPKQGGSGLLAGRPL